MKYGKAEMEWALVSGYLMEGYTFDIDPQHPKGVLTFDSANKKIRLHREEYDRLTKAGKRG